MQIPTQESGPLAKVIAAVGGVILLVVGIMFSLVVLAIALVAGLGIWGWFWWKTRKLREQINAQMGARTQAASDGHVIEGEAVVVVEETTRAASNRLPESPDRRSPD